MAARGDQIVVRTSGRARLEQRAREEGFLRRKRNPDTGEWEELPNLSEYTRLCYAWAEEHHWPQGWRPAWWEPEA